MSTPPPSRSSPPAEAGTETPSRVVFLFLDGVGIGPDDPGVNPFLRARLPSLRGLLAGTLPTLRDPEARAPGGFPPIQGTPGTGGPTAAPRPSPPFLLEAVAFPLDPLLGVSGLPQSGTGQTALFTGANAPRLYGRHFGPWVPVRLRPILEEANLLSRALGRGLSSAFANAYPRGFEQTRWARRPAAPPLMARAAGLLVRDQDALARGDALSSEIVNTAWRERLGLTELPEVTPAEAGRTLARIAARFRLTLFAHYGPDHAGHRGAMEPSVAALERVDEFLGGLLGEMVPGTLLVISSDHGNIEALGRSHTLNPAFTLLAGPGALSLSQGLRAITDLPGAILRYLSDGS